MSGSKDYYLFLQSANGITVAFFMLVLSAFQGIPCFPCSAPSYTVASSQLHCCFFEKLG